MEEVTVAVIAIAFGLSAVFIPTAFISGISGQFYRQFALTIATATLISAFNSLTLSPALLALLLRGHKATKSLFDRAWDVALGWFFRLFNRSFDLRRARRLCAGRAAYDSIRVLLRCCCTLDSSALRERCSGLFPADSDSTDGSGIPHCRHPTSRRRVA